MSRDVIGIEACQHLLANKDAEIERLRADKAELLVALRAAREKLVIYRAERTGVYTGGMEYVDLLRLIDAAITKAESK